jgi:large conductance mechanosensitive channel
MIKEFREFLLRGNVVDLAVAVVIGAAFTTVVNSLVEGVITPLVGIFGIDAMQTWSIQVGPATLNYGLFLTALLNFVIVAAIIFFLVVKPMNAINARRRREEEAAPAGPTEIELLTQIRDELAKRG